MALVAQEIIQQKIERNQKLIYQMPDMIKYINNIKWAEELSGRLESIDVANRERDKTISDIYQVLDSDYNEMSTYLNPKTTPYMKPRN